MFVIMMQMHLVGVKTNIIFLSLTLISSVLSSKEIVIHEINKIENITLINGSSITQGGIMITDLQNKPLLERKKGSVENNNSILQGVMIINDKNITDIHYDIVNIINRYLIEED